MSTPKKIIVVLGPTASGKSELAVKIAKKFNGEIISADSRQVYRGLDIGSGKVPRDKPKVKSQNDYCHKGIKHHLLDVASPKRTFTVVQYQNLAKKALRKILAKNKLPIICGGTGFYIDALIYDYRLPEVPPQPRLRKQLEKKSAGELFQQLKKLDSRRAKNIDKHNKRRLIRALEIVLATGKIVPSKNFLIRRSRNKRINHGILKIGIKKSPEELKKLIVQRLKKRFGQGLVKEVKNLHKKGLSWQRLDDLGLEYRYISRYLRDLISEDEMIKALEKEIYRYSKRQMTWFSAKGGSASGGKKHKKIVWIKNQKEAEELVDKFLKINGSHI